MPPAGTYAIRTYVTEAYVVPSGLPDSFREGGRCLGAAVCLTPAAPVRLHRIRNDQLYHRYLGDAFEVLLLYPDRTHRVDVMGTRIASGQRLRVLIPGRTFHTARLVGAGTWFLGARTEGPAVPADVESGNPAASVVCGWLSGAGRLSASSRIEVQASSAAANEAPAAMVIATGKPAANLTGSSKSVPESPAAKGRAAAAIICPKRDSALFTAEAIPE
jgi:uncharacterized protein